DLETPFTAPVHRPVSSLIYAAPPGCLHSLLVAGRWVFRGGRPEGIDEAEVVREATLRARDLLRRAGLEGRAAGVWPWR
ncbi:MAG TPA: hydrolase, partial [Bacillota bacterium]